MEGIIINFNDITLQNSSNWMVAWMCAHGKIWSTFAKLMMASE